MSTEIDNSGDGAEEKPVVNEKAEKAGEELTSSMLREQLEELEEQKTKLLLNLKEYKEKYEQQKSDQADIYYYLNKKLDENYETIALLEEQILNEQTQREVQERKLEKRIEELQQKMAADETKYNNKLKEAEESLQKVQDFRENKDELEKNLENLLETLENERHHYAELMDENERKSIRERDKFKKECQAQFEDYKQKLEDEADEKLSSKTKKTLLTNKMIKTELNYQSKHADQVLIYNKKVLDKDRELRQELELTQTTQKEMVKRLALYQRLIKQLNEKVTNQEAKFHELMESSRSNLQEKDNEIEDLKHQLNKAQRKPSTRRRNHEDALFDFLCVKYKELSEASGSYKDNSKSFVKKNGDVVLNELIANVLQRFPERFAPLTGEMSPRLFPAISNDRMTNKQLLTGIAAWDSARSTSSTKQNWWSALSQNGDPNAHEQEIGTSQSVQTEGRIMHYPAGSKWLNSSSSGPGSRYFINHDGKRINKSKASNTRVEKLDIDIISNKEGLNRLANGDIFSPMSDPLYRTNNKNDSFSVKTTRSSRSRK